MSDLQKLIIAKTLFSARFWVATVVFYFSELRGIPIGTVLQMMGAYYFMTILLEYPTGVIGDYYSHRLSVFFGYLSLALAFILISLPGSIPFYLVALIVLALGESLVSGSDTALLHTASKNFPRDYSTVKSYGLVMSFVSISLGGFVAAYDLRYPFWLTAGALVVAAGFIFWSKIPNTSSIPGNIFATVTAGFRDILSIHPLLLLMGLSCLTSGFFFAFKYLYNPLFQELHIPLELWGVLAGTTVLIILPGIQLYRRFPNSSLFLLVICIVASIAAIGITSVPAISLLGMLSAFSLRGYFETRTTVEMNDYITEGTRASVLSLDKLLIRGVAMVFAFGSGLIIQEFSLSVLFFATAGVLAVLLTVLSLQLVPYRKTAS